MLFRSGSFYGLPSKGGNQWYIHQAEVVLLSSLDADGLQEGDVELLLLPWEQNGVNTMKL